MLVPEIALTPQVAALFRARFGQAVAIQHSGLSDGERHDQWHRIRRGDVDVVIGTRSAVFAPLANPGLIIVDEEHDTSYKQDETPRYHGRDVAIMRGKFGSALVVIGSATPTIESYANAIEGKYTLVTMNKRVLDRPLASVSVVNMREEIAEAGEDVVLSRPLLAGIEDRLERGEQSLILLNRRGFATAVVCRQCTAVLECPNCSINLTIHSLSRRSPQGEGGDWKARCHYCNFQKTGAEDLRSVRGAVHGTRRLRHRARRGRNPQDVPDRADCARRSRHRAAQGQSGRDARESRRSRDRHPDRHADDREGARLPALHAGRRDLGGRRSRARRLSIGRAHLPVADAGCRPRRPRRASGRGDHSVPAAASLQHQARLRAGLPRLLREGSRVPARDALSAAGRDGQRRGAGQDLHGGDGCGARAGGRSPRRARVCDRRRVCAPGTGAGAAHQASRRASRAIFPEKQQPQGDARGPATGAVAQADRSPSASRSTSIRCRCSTMVSRTNRSG